MNCSATRRKVRSDMWVCSFSTSCYRAVSSKEKFSRSTPVSFCKKFIQAVKRASSYRSSSVLLWNIRCSWLLSNIPRCDFGLSLSLILIVRETDLACGSAFSKPLDGLILVWSAYSTNSRGLSRFTNALLRLLWVSLETTDMLFLSELMDWYCFWAFLLVLIWETALR